MDLALQRNDVSSVPVPQQAFLDSKNPGKEEYFEQKWIKKGPFPNSPFLF